MNCEICLNILKGSCISKFQLCSFASTTRSSFDYKSSFWGTKFGFWNTWTGEHASKMMDS